MCIHGGTSMDCKRCNTPYKSIFKKSYGLSWKKIKNADSVSGTYSIKTAMGYSQNNTIDLR